MTPQSNDAAAALAAGNEALKALAVGEGLADAAMGKFFALIADQIGDGTREFSDTAPLYTWRYELMNNIKRSLNREESPMPSGNSLASQLTKAKTITQLGVYERKRSGTVAVLRTVATVPGCQWKYKPLLVAAGAIAATLDDEPDASDERLLDAANEAIDNIEAKVKTASVELAKIVKAYDKLVADPIHGAALRNAAASPDTDADLATVSSELSLLLNAVVALEAKAGSRRK